MRKFLNVFKKCPLFFDVSDDDIITMLGCLKARTDMFDKNYTILSEESPAKYIGIVLSGSVQITQTDYYGNRSILGNLCEGELFAEAFACMQMASMPVSVVANEKSNIMFIDCNHILHTCQNGCPHHQQLIYNLMKVLALKTVMFQQKIEVISKRTTREKLLTYLTTCAKKNNRNSFKIPFNRQELADYLEVDRSGLSAQISKLRKEGVLECRGNYFNLL